MLDESVNVGTRQTEERSPAKDLHATRYSKTTSTSAFQTSSSSSTKPRCFEGVNWRIMTWPEDVKDALDYLCNIGQLVTFILVKTTLPLLSRHSNRFNNISFNASIFIKMLHRGPTSKLSTSYSHLMWTDLLSILEAEPICGHSPGYSLAARRQMWLIWGRLFGSDGRELGAHIPRMA
jgi:hypothetical protein